MFVMNASGFLRKYRHGYMLMMITVDCDKPVKFYRTFNDAIRGLIDLRTWIPPTDSDINSVDYDPLDWKEPDYAAEKIRLEALIVA